MSSPTPHDPRIRDMLHSLALCAGVLSITACEKVEAPGESAGALIGGEEDTAHPAVGALATRTMMGSNGEIVEAFCTGTLISPRHVLTAEHCFSERRANLAFVLDTFGTTVLGPERRDPRRLVNIVRVDMERDIAGGGIGLGSDVAIAELAEPITDVKPVNVGYLEPADIGKQFQAVGYGVHDVEARGDGVKRTGTIELRAIEGKLLQVAFPRFDDYVNRTGLSVDEARAEYEGMTLLPQYEALAGATVGSVQGCEGDSGGPLLRKASRKETIFGVASFVLSTRASPCEGGVIYATFGPKARAFIESRLRP